MPAASLKCRRFFSRASERICLSIVAEFVGVEFRTYSSRLQRCCWIAFGNRSDQIHSTLRRVFDVGVLDVSAIYHHLFRRFFRIGMDRMDTMDQFIVIRASLRRLDGYNVFMRGLGTNLNVIAGCKSSIRLFHHSSFRIALADAHSLFRVLTILSRASSACLLAVPAENHDDSRDIPIIVFDGRGPIGNRYLCVVPPYQ